MSSSLDSKILYFTLGEKAPDLRFQQGFSALELFTFWHWAVPIVGSYPVCSVIFGSIPGLCPLDVVTPMPPSVKTKTSSSYCQMSLGVGESKTLPSRELFGYSIKYFFLLFFFFYTRIWIERASLITQLVKNLPAMQETPVRFLGLEDVLEKR